MQYSEFEREIERLRRVYSPTSLNEERIKLYWERFKAVERRVFESAVNWLIVEATNQQLPAMSRFAEAVGMFRTNPNGVSMVDLPPAMDCEVCRDFGYFFNVDIVTACRVCRRGREIAPAALAKAQISYDRGAGFLTKGRQRDGYFRDLPYNPDIRGGA